MGHVIKFGMSKERVKVAYVGGRGQRAEKEMQKLPQQVQMAQPTIMDWESQCGGY